MAARSGDRQRKLSVWVSDDELQRVNGQAAALGITAAALVRSWIAGDTGPSAESVQETREVRHTMEEVLLELHREGTNLNQIARSVNSGADPTSEHILRVLSEIRQSLGVIESRVCDMWEV